MKITKYELLGLVKDGKAPKKIKYNDKIWRLASDGTYFIGSDYGYDFWVEHGDDKFEDEHITLNDEVEILEEEKKIPEKLKWKPKESMAGQLTQKEQIEVIARRTEKLKKEFNNLIDYLKSKGE